MNDQNQFIMDNCWQQEVFW